MSRFYCCCWKNCLSSSEKDPDLSLYKPRLRRNADAVTDREAPLYGFAPFPPRGHLIPSAILPRLDLTLLHDVVDDGAVAAATLSRPHTQQHPLLVFVLVRRSGARGCGCS
jgi:hypothetical protein